MRIGRCFLIFYIFHLTAVIEVHAAIINAASCSNEDVQTAINTASDGDTVEIASCPSGVNWDDGYMPDMSRCYVPGWACAGVQIPDTKGITLKGQGVGQTVIITDIAIAIWANTLDTNSQVEITGLDFRMGTGTTDQGVIVIKGQAKDWRVHHNRFGTASDPYLNRQFWIGHHYGDCTYGLWDHNEHHAFESGNGMVLMGGCYGGGDYGDNGWQTALDWGSANWMFFEDNKFYAYGETGHGGGGPDNGSAAKIVFRYNTVDDSYPTHGAESGGRHRGHRASDIYNNTFTARVDKDGAISIRAGTAIPLRFQTLLRLHHRKDLK